MKYVRPTIVQVELQAAAMLAESLYIYNDKNIDGNQALIKEYDDWNIWGEE